MTTTAVLSSGQKLNLSCIIIEVEAPSAYIVPVCLVQNNEVKKIHPFYWSHHEDL